MNRIARVLFVVLALALLSTAALAAEYAPGEALVVLKNDIGEVGEGSLSRAAALDGYVEGVARAVSASEVETFRALSNGGKGIFALMKSSTKTTEELVAELKANENVLSVSPNYVYRALARPNDADYSSLWGLPRIGAEDAWDVTSGDARVYVAVLDTGILSNHEDLAANVDIGLSRNFTANQLGNAVASDYIDRQGHGTHVAGIIGAVGNNEKGVAGVNWNVKIIALKVLDDGGSGYVAWQVAAFDYLAGLMQADPNLRIPAINLSLGGYQETSPTEYITSPIWLAFKTIDTMNRSVIVVAAGNEANEVGVPSQYDMMDIISGAYVARKGDYCYPASSIGLNNLIVVGSISSALDADSRNAASDFTNWSAKYVHLAAPGSYIYSTYADGEYAFQSGTSMAAPHVAGAAALLAAAKPTLTANEIKSHLLRTAESQTNPKAEAYIWEYWTGYRRPISPQTLPDTTVSSHGLLDIGNAVRTQPIDVPVESIQLLCVDTEIDLGQSTQIAEIVSPETATDKRVSWTALDPSVLSVTSSGTVTGLRAGMTQVMAMTQDGSHKTASVTIRVRAVGNPGDNDSDYVHDGGSSGCDVAAMGMLAVFALGALALRRRAAR